MQHSSQEARGTHQRLGWKPGPKANLPPVPPGGKGSYGSPSWTLLRPVWRTGLAKPLSESKEDPLPSHTHGHPLLWSGWTMKKPPFPQCPYKDGGESTLPPMLLQTPNNSPRKLQYCSGITKDWSPQIHLHPQGPQISPHSGPTKTSEALSKSSTCPLALVQVHTVQSSPPCNCWALEKCWSKMRWA